MTPKQAQDHRRSNRGRARPVRRSVGTLHPDAASESAARRARVSQHAPRQRHRCADHFRHSHLRRTGGCSSGASRLWRSEPICADVVSSSSSAGPRLSVCVPEVHSPAVSTMPRSRWHHCGDLSSPAAARSLRCCCRRGLRAGAGIAASERHCRRAARVHRILERRRHPSCYRARPGTAWCDCQSHRHAAACRRRPAGCGLSFRGHRAH